MIEQLTAAKAVIVFAVFAALFVGERIIGQARQPQDGPARRARLFHNVGLWAITIPLSPLIVLPITAWASGNPLWQRPDWWSGAVGLCLDLLILDLWCYLLHRTYHRVPAMWRLHEIHHRDEFLDSTSAFRFHFVEVALSAAIRAGLIVMLAIPFASVVVFEIAAAAVVLLHHSNLRLPGWLERPLSAVIVTPSIHWVHHHVERTDTNSNYGTIFSWWDRLFGTRSGTVRVDDLPIGLDDARDIPLLRLIVQPFRGRTRRVGDE